MEGEVNSVDEYIESQPEAVRPVLTAVRAAIRQALPEAHEVISYNMPTYKLNGLAVIYFAAWKTFFSIYPAGEQLQTVFKNDLGCCEINKSTLRFPVSKPVPIELIRRIAEFRVKELAGRAAARPRRAR